MFGYTQHLTNSLSSLIVIALSLWSNAVLAVDPTTADCLRANERSIELRNRHQLRAARAELLICAAGSCPEDVRNECARRVAEVNHAMPTVVFDVKDPQDNDLSAVTVHMDGELVTERLEGTAISVDPGVHTFEFATPDTAPVTKQLLIRESEKARRIVVVLGPHGPDKAETPDETAATTAPNAATAAAPLATRATHSEGNGTLRTVGVIVGSVGLLAAGFAVYEQVHAHSLYSDSEKAGKASLANSDLTQSDVSRDKYDDAKSAQTIALISGAAGVAALGTGLVLLLTNLGGSESREPRAARGLHVEPAFGMSGGTLTLKQTF